MGRSEKIARSIVRAVLRTEKPEPKKLAGRLAAALSALFKLYALRLHKLSPELFAGLRAEHWATPDGDYSQSFTAGADQPPEEALSLIGDMGYSGSTFFSTADQRWLVKSVPRAFEYTFFRDDLLQPYAEHMSAHATSLLIRICDFLSAAHHPLGGMLGLAPTHHIVMENIMYGQEQVAESEETRWESWDLKPTSYFFPERDVASGMLASEATKSKLADKFEDKIVLTKEQAEQFLNQVDTDTRMLAEHNAVDYSLFLVRIKLDQTDPFADPVETGTVAEAIPREPPFVPPGPPSWRTGVQSVDGKYIFRAALLDFFWAKHMTHPRVMTGLISLWNLVISRHGHMTITTHPDEYQERFMKMCRELVEVRES